MFKRDCNHFVAVSGARFMGFLTLTLPSHTSMERANKAFAKLLRSTGANWIAHWVKVLDFTRKGKPHFHVLILCRADIAEGTDFDAIERYRLACKLASEAAPLSSTERRTMRNATTNNAFLLRFWKRMDAKLHGLGFGWEFDFFPLRHPGKTVTYMSNGAFPRVGTAGNAKTTRPSVKRVQRFKFSSGCPRASKLPAQGTWYLARSCALLAACGQQEITYFAKHWGRQRGFIVSRVLSPRLSALNPEWPEMPPVSLARLIMVSLYTDLHLRSHLEPIIRDVFKRAYPDAPFPNQNEHNSIPF